MLKRILWILCSEWVTGNTKLKGGGSLGENSRNSMSGFWILVIVGDKKYNSWFEYLQQALCK